MHILFIGVSEDIFDSLYDGEKLSYVIRLVAYGMVEEFQTRREVNRSVACQPLLRGMCTVSGYSYYWALHL